MTIGHPPRHGSPRRPIAALLFWAALLLIAAAEFVTAAVQPTVGLLMHGALLVGLFLGAMVARRPEHQHLALALVLAPLIRLLSVGLPLARLAQLAWYPAVGLPLLAAVWLIVRQIGLRREELGLRQGDLPIELALMAGGFTLGTVEYTILQPELPFSAMNAWIFVLAALCLLIFTGFSEELIFRGLLQRLALPALGRSGLIYVSLLFGVLHIGHLSVVDVAFVTLVAVLFAHIARLQGSIVGVTLAHGLTNLTLFVIMPFLNRDRPDLIPFFIWGPLAAGTALWVWAVGMLTARAALRRLAAVGPGAEPAEQVAARQELRALLRSRRRERLLLFSDLAARTGIPQRQLAAFEAGLARPSAEEQRLLARELGIAAPALQRALEQASMTSAV